MCGAQGGTRGPPPTPLCWTAPRGASYPFCTVLLDQAALRAINLSSANSVEESVIKLLIIGVLVGLPGRVLEDPADPTMYILPGTEG